ncbi:MAG: TMEM165/GDT1 family protein [Brevinematia bacterium]
MITSLATSFFVILLAEIADKTMFLTIGLSTKLKKLQLILGIFLATVVVMLIPVLLGEWLNRILPKATLILASGLLFIIIGIFWFLEREESKEGEKTFNLPDFLKAFLVFFLAEMGDKTQLSTFSLAIRFDDLLPVWIGASLGLFLPNLIIAFLCCTFLAKLNTKVLRFVAGGIFLAIGIIVILEYWGII